MSWRDSEMERGSPVHRPLNPVTVSRREESLAAGSHPQSNSNQGSPASACLPPTLHPVTASTFPPTTLLLTGFTYYFSHTRTSHSVSLHTQAHGWLVNNGGNKFRNKWCEHCHMTWRCTAPPWGFLWHFTEWVSHWLAGCCFMFLWFRMQVGWRCRSASTPEWNRLTCCLTLWK